MRISIIKYPLYFKQAAGTSRGVLHKKNTWFIKVFEPVEPQEYGIGEINMFEGLSYDSRPDFYDKLKEMEQYPQIYIDNPNENLIEYPAIRFGLDTAILDFQQRRNRILFPSDFTKGDKGIPINGLIWMGDYSFMKTQIKQKLDAGFRCLKMKIGAINFETELDILKSIRQEYKEQDLELRVDANGAFDTDTAMDKRQRLAPYHIHSIEQPIKQGQWEFMAELCKSSPIDIALDEELIGIHDLKKKKELLEKIRPQYIILKPALTGGFAASQEWINLANDHSIDWWITSALESNIGLNAIAQWTYQLKTTNYQGLGTGQLFTNNINSPLKIKGDHLYYQASAEWEIKT
ncbi:MAG: o-succinylbenzoate synthase [Bacteroidales bacterium]|nr:o-succinylbenzoate synthase [Bacteroidales bacterium]